MKVRIHTATNGQEYIVLVGDNGEPLMNSETYTAGHGSADRAARSLADAIPGVEIVDARGEAELADTPPPPASEGEGRGE